MTAIVQRPSLNNPPASVYMFETQTFEEQISGLAFALWYCEFLPHVIQYLSTWRCTAKENKSSSKPDLATSGENQLPLADQKW